MSQTALVTGSNRGIGLELCRQLKERGFDVIATCRHRSPALTELDVEIIEDVEVSDPISLKALTEKLGDRKIDWLINNAGITRDNILMRMKQNEWDEIIDTNLASVFKMSKAVLRGMMKKKAGRIVSITSVVGAMGNSGQTNYAAAKAGIMGFTKSLAREVGSRGITVNTVAPGFIQTDMTDALPDEQKKALSSQIPMARLGTVDEIAQTVLFLAGEGGSYITAQTLHVNGGMYTP